MRRFLLDANLAPGLAKQVIASGHNCQHVFESLSADARDAEIVELANRLEAAVVTKDADYFDLKERGLLRTPLIWLRSGNMSNRRTAQILLSALPQIVAAIDAGEAVIEIR